MEVSIIQGTDGQTPKRSTKEAAGYDLYAANSGSILSNQRQLVSLGIRMKLKQGTYGQIYARSGLAFKQGIIAMAGVIDSDYRDEVKVLLYNSGYSTFEYKKGDRIAQMVIHKIVQSEPTVTEWLSDDSDEIKNKYSVVESDDADASDQDEQDTTDTSSNDSDSTIASVNSDDDTTDRKGGFGSTGR